MWIFKIKKEKLPPIQLNRISFLTDIQYIENTVADAFLRIEAISESLSTILNFNNLSHSKTNDQVLSSFLNSLSSMTIKKIKIPGLDVQTYCDTSTGKNRPYINPSYRKQVFDSIHSSNHPSTWAITKIVWDRCSVALVFRVGVPK